MLKQNPQRTFIPELALNLLNPQTEIVCKFPFGLTTDSSVRRLQDATLSAIALVALT